MRPGGLQAEERAAAWGPSGLRSYVSGLPQEISVLEFFLKRSHDQIHYLYDAASKSCPRPAGKPYGVGQNSWGFPAEPRSRHTRR